MLNTETFPQAYFLYLMSTGMQSGGDAIDSGIGDAADRILVGKGHQQMNVHFDRSQNWDEEREVLTDRQRIRDLETYVFGDRRGLITGVLRQMRSHVVWLIILSLLQFLAILLLALLIYATMGSV